MSPIIMGAPSGTHEIVELNEKYDPDSNVIENTGSHPPLKKKHKIEDDINKLFEAIEIGRGVGKQERCSRDSLNRRAMKRPMRVGLTQVSSIGISEQVSIKQALRGLCISHASEMAAVKKRMSRPSLASPAVSESGALRKLKRTVLVELEGSQQPPDEVKQNFVEISLVPERDGSFSGGSELLEASKDIGSSEESARPQNLVKKRTSVAKSQIQHSKGVTKDGDDHSKEMIHHTRDPIPETGCDAVKGDEHSRLKEKGEISVSQSSKSSIGEHSSTTTSYSEESSYRSGSSRSSYRPHMSKDLRWEAIRSFQKQNENLGLRHFKLLRKIGGGDIGTVYLSELIGTSCLFAVKVMDNEFLVSRKKMMRAQTEKEILEILDHPFLPTLYAHFANNKFSCLVMEYCPGGDLHVLRQKQLTKSFPEKAARFYVAEVLLALEYLHMLGVVYRDLKPENILVREDGHIMLSDFDLSLRCAVNPMVIKSSSPIVTPTKKMLSPCSDSTTCMDPFCLQPSWQLSCFTPRFLSAASKTRKLKSELTNQVNPLPQLVVEPTSARSNSFVGTHEYLAPEIIRGEGHGSAVDWWTLGIFLYELLYGRTPFKGSTNEETISNVVSECLKFPQCPTVGSHARDLIGRLLKKEPESRMGSTKGAAEIKEHSFFEGVNWALVRCETPPEMPKLYDWGNVVMADGVEFGSRGDGIEFEMF